MDVSNLEPVPKELQIYNAARAYAAGAGVIEKHTRIENTMMFAIQPCVTCATFAVELYLKCLLEIQGNQNVKGHNLLKLFQQLSGENKQGILTHFQKRAKNEHLPMGFLEAKFQEMENAFVEWRYLHETKQAFLNLEALRCSSFACQQQIKFHRPNWP